MIRNACIFLFFIIIIPPIDVYSSQIFDELDKPPEGSHQGQMFLGAVIMVGFPRGNIINAEKSFLKGSYYTFDNEVSKSIDLSHLCFGIGVVFEYMPWDRIGIKSNLRRSFIVQRSIFGEGYENWNGYLYRDISLNFGPSIHTTIRKRWDFTFYPLIGYSFSRFAATPVAKQILEGYDGRKTRRSTHGVYFGSELNCVIYFSKGLYLSLGVEWVRYSLNFGSSLDVTNQGTDPDKLYFNGKKSGYIDTFNIIISSGYAFFN